MSQYLKQRVCVFFCAGLLAACAETARGTTPFSATKIKALDLGEGGLVEFQNNGLILTDPADSYFVTPSGGTLSGSQGLVQAILDGYDAGDWKGTTGFTGTNAMADPAMWAIGYGSVSDLGLVGTNWGGIVLSASDANDFLIRETLVGGATMEAGNIANPLALDTADYNRWLNGSQLGLTGWENGDFNYNGVVNGEDLLLMENNGYVITPEPSTAVLLAVGAAGLLGYTWRRRRTKARIAVSWRAAAAFLRRWGCVAALLLLLSPSQSRGTNWTLPPGQSGDWSAVANWDSGLPTSSTAADILSGGTANVTVPGVSIGESLVVSKSSTLQMTGGNLTASGGLLFLWATMARDVHAVGRCEHDQLFRLSDGGENNLAAGHTISAWHGPVVAPQKRGGLRESTGVFFPRGRNEHHPLAHRRFEHPRQRDLQSHRRSVPAATEWLGYAWGFGSF